MFNNETKLIDYSKTMNILLGSGGEIEDLKSKEEEGLVFDTAIITNLSVDVGV